MASGVAEGAEMYQPACDLPERGYFFRPTLFTNVAQSHRIAREEIFGPVLSVLTFRTPDEAVEKANNTPYGLSAGIWTDKGSRILSMVSKMRAGVVWANTFNRFDPTSPFGGYKESGFGREGGMHGLHAVRPARGPLMASADRPDRIGGPQDLQAVHRRRVPADRVRPLVSGQRRGRHAARQRLPGVPQGPARRGPRGAQGGRRLGRPTAMNRGQVLYRVAELMEGRRDQFIAEVSAAEGLRDGKAREVVDRAIDRWVWYAGWADKIAQVLGSSNPVAAPYFNFTIPEPTGVVGIVAPETSSLLGLVSRLAPPLVSGNTVVLVTSETRPLPAVTLSEVLATSDVPGGVVNVLTGRKAELVPVMAGHVDVDAIDTWGVPDAHAPRHRAARRRRHQAHPAPPDDRRRRPLRLARRPRRRAPEWIAAFLEMKTVWHPIGV